MSLEGKSLFLATPMYGGMAHAGYITSLLALRELCTQLQVPMVTAFLYNESLITRGRNKLVSFFLRSDATHLLFVDADVQFNPSDALSLLRLDLPIVGGAYSKKSLNWERVLAAAKAGATADDLPNVAASPCFNLCPCPEIDTLTPVEVSEIGTGFLMIRRDVFEAMRAAAPDDFYMDDIDGKGDKIHRFFDCAVRDGRYLSEDFYFTRRWADLGGKTHLCPWMRTVHFGTHGFVLDLPAIARTRTSL